MLEINRRTLRRWTVSGHITSHIRKCDGRIVYYGSDVINCYYDVI